MTEEVKRRGRPPKEPLPGTRVSLGLKVTPETKRRLDEAARASGRTQSQEAEKLIEEAMAVDRLGTQLVEVRKAAEEFRRAKEYEAAKLFGVLKRQNDLVLSELAVIRKMLEGSGPPELAKSATAGDALGAAIQAADDLNASYEGLSKVADDPASVIAELHRVAAEHREMAGRLDTAAEQIEARVAPKHRRKAGLR